MEKTTDLLGVLVKALQTWCLPAQSLCDVDGGRVEQRVRKQTSVAALT
jgi:hypothetical protein